ncbi:MAG: hypothetical protein OXC45_00140 [Gemmatimonadetes bacterium]|nr:hypothetical protein [Gemmatimonadota bacterium]
MTFSIVKEIPTALVFTFKDKRGGVHNPVRYFTLALYGLLASLVS